MLSRAKAHCVGGIVGEIAGRVHMLPGRRSIVYMQGHMQASMHTAGYVCIRPLLCVGKKGHIALQCRMHGKGNREHG